MAGLAAVVDDVHRRSSSAVGRSGGGGDPGLAAARGLRGGEVAPRGRGGSRESPTRQASHAEAVADELRIVASRASGGSARGPLKPRQKLGDLAVLFGQAAALNGHFQEVTAEWATVSNAVARSPFLHILLWSPCCGFCSGTLPVWSIAPWEGLCCDLI
jgi:hypothetical protein